MRNVESDINIHVQYESWRAAAAARREPGALAVIHRPLKRLQLGGRPAYHMVVFENGSSEPFYAKLHTAMAEPVRPLFLAVDDDLLRPPPHILAYHRERLTAFFQRYWPEPAPWELAARVPPLLDPAAFAVAPPSPDPSPSPPPSPLTAGLAQPQLVLWKQRQGAVGRRH